MPDAPFEPGTAASESADCARIANQTRRRRLYLQGTEFTRLALRITVETAFDLGDSQGNRD